MAKTSKFELARFLVGRLLGALFVVILFNLCMSTRVRTIVHHIVKMQIYPFSGTKYIRIRIPGGLINIFRFLESSGFNLSVPNFGNSINRLLIMVLHISA